MGAARASTRTAWERIRASSVAGNVSFAGTPIWKMAGPWVISWYISMNEPGSGGCSDRVTARGRSATWVPVARDATMSCAADSFS